MKSLAKSKIILLLSFSVYLIGCASTQNQQDPWESMNRTVFEFNEVVDNNVIEPAARGYKRFVPQPIRLVVGNAFSNANDVVVTANSILQLNFESAAASATRFVINTTFGLFGAIDIASDISEVSDINISKRNEDFGQTMGRYGVATGPYLVIPFLGPSTVRDAVGVGVDSLVAHPVTTIVYLNSVNTLDAAIRTPVAMGMALDARAQLLDVDKTLEEAALDKYEFVRDAYLQRRDSLVKNEDVELTD
ncbi:VacJ family lipoprotein [Nitrosomonas sp.]|uniref:MlaA family lipoprotein n=1 Tax=Nitrosomonas sp. TaxID=42353 RepID=UPI001DA1F39F|nr:VacJ family lipoprotein [Nitrosomonas sp.]MCB1949442.1 VacJ family lipoprotein [Nitrosomonas sp.]MCP5243170.1 VacJ family lipoprotein [Burkholderiales bacterium]MDR4513951.1 VacJ family lipoprotein [Nitrosomonas sp.]